MESPILITINVDDYFLMIKTEIDIDDAIEKLKN
jgi:hypothetical protein